MKIKLQKFDNKTYVFGKRIHIVGKNNTRKSTFTKEMRLFFSGQSIASRSNVVFTFDVTSDLSKNKELSRINSEEMKINVGDELEVKSGGKVYFKLNNLTTNESVNVRRGFFPKIFDVYDYDSNSLSNETSWIRDTKEMLELEKKISSEYKKFVAQINKKYKSKIEKSIKTSIDDFTTGSIINRTLDLTKNIPRYLELGLKKKGISDHFKIANQGAADKRLISLSLHNNLKLKTNKIPVYVLDEFDSNFENSRSIDFWKNQVPLLKGIVITVSHSTNSITNSSFPHTYLFSRKSTKLIEIKKISDISPKYKNETNYSFLFNDWTIIVEGKTEVDVYNNVLAYKSNSNIIQLNGGSANIDDYISWKKYFKGRPQYINVILDLDVFYKVINSKVESVGIHRKFGLKDKTILPKNSIKKYFTKDGKLIASKFKDVSDLIFKKYNVNVHFGDLEKQYISKLKSSDSDAKDIWNDSTLNFKAAKVIAQTIINKNKDKVQDYAEKWLESIKK